MTQTTCQLHIPHIAFSDMKGIEIAGKTFHFFSIGGTDCEDLQTLINHLYLRVSEVIEGYPSQVVHIFLTHLRSLPNLPEFIWVDHESSEEIAITPVPFLEALNFWAQQSHKTGNPWAKLVTKEAIQIEEAVCCAFCWGDESFADLSLGWDLGSYDGGLRIRQVPKPGLSNNMHPLQNASGEPR